MSEQNPNLVPNVTHQPTLLGGAENIKLLFDEELDNRRERLADQRAWEVHKLRMAGNQEAFDNFIRFTTAGATATSQQTGQTANEQAVSPIRTGTGDTVAASAYPANRATDTAVASVAAAVAESVQTNVTTQISALTEQITGLGGTITTALQALADSNALIASALSALKPAA